MANSIPVTPELLNSISALSELGNTVEHAATILNISAEDFALLLHGNPQARNRWEKGSIEAANQLKTFLHRQAGAGSVQAAKLLLQIKGAEKPEKAAPLLSTTTPPQPNSARDSADWAPIADVAETINVTAHAIRKRIDHAAWPKLEVRELRGARCVSAILSYDHFCSHGSRRPDGLRKPPGYDEWKTGFLASPLTPADVSIDPEIRAALGGANPLEMDPDELAHRLAVANVDPVRARLAILNADRNQRRKTAELKAAAMIGTDVVRKMIRAHAEFIKEQTDDRDKAWAEELLRFLAATFGLDPAAKRPDALALIACFYREQMNVLFAGLESLVKEQMQRVRGLEFNSAAGAARSGPVDDALRELACDIDGGRGV